MAKAIKDQKALEAERIKAKIVKTYLRAVKKYKRVPTESELRDLGLTRHTIRWHFKNPQALRAHCKEVAPEYFENLIDESVFNDEQMAELESLIADRSTVVISTAVTGSRLHKGFYEAIKNFCKKKKGVDLYIPVTDPAADAAWDIAPELGASHVVGGDLALNSNIFISGIKMSAKQIDPTTGLNRMGHKMSFIFGSPKQRLKVKANSNFKHPHVSMGTGAITRPNYKTSRYMSERTAKLAEVDHKIGAIIVELEPSELYFFRQIQASASGAFADLGKLYKPNGEILDYPPEFFVMGDLHPGESDPVALTCWEDIVKETKAQNIVLHDAVNGHSISHWVEGKIIEKAVLAREKMTNLEQEGKLCAEHFRRILSWLPSNGKVYIVPSNHNDFLYRYLNDKRFVKDYENLDFVARVLLPKVLNGEDPAKVLVEHFLDAKEKARIVWWKEDEDFRYAGVQLAAHGDRGPNGGKGNIMNQEEAYGPCIVGHSHTPGIYREAYQVGTTTFRKLRYAKGPSSWMQTSCLLYRNGSRQLINCIDGKWRKK